MKSLATCTASMFAGLLCFALLSGVATQAYAQPAVSFATWTTNTGEGSGSHTVNVGVTLSPAQTTDMTIKYRVRSVRGYKATPGSDFTITNSGTLTVPAGATTAAIPVTIVDDSLVEHFEQFWMDFVADPGYRAGRIKLHLVSIADNDTPIVTFASASRSERVDEGAGTRTIGVKLDKALSTDLDVSWSAWGHVTPGADFSIPGATSFVIDGRVFMPTQTLTIPAGDTTATLTVTIIDDTVRENLEYLLLTLNNRTLGPVDELYRAGGTYSLAIVDNDTLPVITVAAGTSPVTEGGDAVFTVTASPVPAADLAVTVAVAADGDYGIADGSRTVTIPTTGSATLTLTTTNDEADEPDGSVTATVAAGDGYTVGDPASDSVSIQDNDEPPPAEPAVTIAAGASPVTEGGDAVFTVTASPAPAADLAVTVAVAADGDYGIADGSRTVTIPTTGSATLTLTTTNDEADEPDGSVTATVATGDGYTVGDPASGSVSIQDNDEPPPAEPAVTIAAGTSPVTEGGDAVFTVTASPAPAADLAVSVTVAADGEYGITAGKQTVTIPTTGSATLTLTTTNDEADEPDGSVTATVAAGDGYTVGDPASGSVSIQDNDEPPTVSFATWTTNTSEGSDPRKVEVGVTLNPAQTTDITIKYRVRSEGALQGDPGSDFTITNSGTLTVPAGATTAAIPVTIIDDSLQEYTEAFRMDFVKDASYRVVNPKLHVMTIADNDTPVVTFASVSRSESVDEGGGTRNVGVKLDKALTSDMTISYTARGTATRGSDFSIPGRVLTSFHGYSVLVPKGATTATIPVTIIDDSLQEDREYVQLTLISIDGLYRAGSTYSLAIVDNDTLPVITVAAGASPVTEGGDAVFTVTASPAPAADLAVSVDIAADGAYGITAGKQTVTIPTTGSATLTLATTGDEVDEPDGSVTATVAAGDGYTVGAPASGSVSIEDDDEPPPAEPAVTIAAGASPVTEGGDAVFTVTASPAPAADLAVSVTVAADGEYGITAGKQTVTIPTTGSATLTLTTTNDEADEADGSVTATVQDGEGYTVGSSASGTVAIADDDPTPTATVVDPALVAQVRGYAAETWKHPDHVDRWRRVLAAFGDDNGYTAMTAAEAQTYADRGWQRWVPVVDALKALEAAPVPQQQVVTVPAVSVAAGADVTEGGDAVFTVTASPAPAADLAVSVDIAADGAYGITAGKQTVTIPTTGSATLTLATTNDDTDEPDGSVTATVAAGEGYTVGDPASGSVSIEDNDEPPPAEPAVTIAAGASPVTEGGDATFTLTASPAPASPLSVSVTVAADGEYGVTAGEKTVTVPTTGSFTLTLATANDDVDEPDGSVTATLEDGEGYTVGDPASDSVSIQDNDEPPPAVTIAAGASPVTEGGDTTFTVTATPAPAADLAVTVAVAADGDYGIADGSRTVTVPTTGSATLTLTTTNDDADEPDGSVTVTVGAGDGYTVGDPASGSVSIQDNDEPPPAVTIAAGASPVTEGGDAVFTVTASPVPAADLAVTVAVAADGEYGVTAGSRTVTVPTTGSATLTLTTTNDDADEADGSVTATVQDGEGYTVGSPASGSVSIADDDLPPPAVSIAAKAASVTEGGAAAFTLTADRAPDADLTVTLSVAETGGGDHVAAADEGPATAVIAKGETEAVFSVATVDDEVDEPDGSVTVTVKAGEGYTVASSQGAATVTVSDDDAAAGPVLSVADATATEGDGASLMWFTVRLSPGAAKAVTVRAYTRPSTPVSARPGGDYWPLRSRLVRFRPGETEQRVAVVIFDDSHDEEAETFEVVLSDARGAPIGDGVAVGTIVNDDPMPAAWLARFGRTVAEQALDGIAGRMAADRTPGMRGAIAGQALSFGAPANDNPGSRSGASAAPGHAATGSPASGGTGALALAKVAQAFGGHAGGFGAGGIGHDAAGFGNGSLSPGSVSGADGAGFTQSRSMSAREALLGSSFSLTGATDGSGGSMAFWGRAAQARFDGREGTFSLDGEVTTGMLGADYARGKWLVGLAFAQSAGEGDYRDTGSAPRPDGQGCPDGVDGSPCSGAVRAGDGSVEASLTAAIPYVSLRASERLKLWGAAGYGTGEVTLKTAMGGRYKSDTSWNMAAAGMRGDLLAPPAEGSGPALAVTSDALWTRTSSEKTGDLAASDSDATRLRLGLEGSYRMALEGGGHLTPKLEIGARHDGGDAETGFGVELGGGIAWSDPALGLSLDVSGRTLIAHGNDDLRDRGYAAALAYRPDPATKQGPSFSLRQEFGARAAGGLDALFAPDPLEDRTGSAAATSRWAMEAAWGVPAFGGRWTGSPHVGLGLATGTRDYSVGWRLAPEAATAANVSFGLRATRRESDAQAAEHTVGVEITARW